MPATLQPCVIDTNILIDLQAGRILRPIFGLALYLMTTDLLLEEFRGSDLAQLEDRGLIRCELAPADVEELARLRAQYTRLSIPDLSALVLAHKTRSMLLTGEADLRSIAQRRGLTVHGTLWVLDEMIRCGLVPRLVASKALQRMMQGNSRLPAAQCKARLAQWGAVTNLDEGG
jgi:predicted nucleic acid-binding protein